MVALPGRSSLPISEIIWSASKGGLSKSSCRWGSLCSNIVTTTQFYSRFSSHHWSQGDNTKLPSWAFNLRMKLPPNTFWTPLSPKRAQLAHSDSELLFSSLYLTLLSFSYPHSILPHTLSTIFHCTYARSTHSQNLKKTLQHILSYSCPCSRHLN